MSSTMIIAPDASPDGSVYFAKNSNRPPGECQLVVTLPKVERDAESVLHCTHLTIVQERRRYGVLLSKPWWAWGGEMGANDQGVVIGCEPLNTRDHESVPGLIGMDLVRLGLERGRNAREALEVITSLLQKHGQGGFAGVSHVPMGRDSGFLIADAKEVWQLETAGRHWAARRITTVAALSGDITIGDQFDRYSYACPEYARHQGWLGAGEELDFRRCLGSRGRPLSNDSRQLSVLLTALHEVDKRAPLLDMMRLVRRRAGNHPRQRSRRDVARHSGRRYQLQTTGTMVACLTSSRQDFFFTAAAAPDLAVFKPIHFGQPLESDLDGEDLSHYYDGSLWWRQEMFHRALLLAGRIDDKYLQERDELEKEIVLDILGHKGSALTDLRWKLQQRTLIWEREWREQITARRTGWLTLRPFSLFWKRQNRRDGLKLPGPADA